MPDFQRFYASLQCWGWGVKQGIRWLGLVFGLVQSKDAKVWCPVWVLGGAKQVCKARMPSKQASKDKQTSKGLVLGVGC